MTVSLQNLYWFSSSCWSIKIQDNQVNYVITGNLFSLKDNRKTVRVVDFYYLGNPSAQQFLVDDLSPLAFFNFGLRNLPVPA